MRVPTSILALLLAPSAPAQPAPPRAPPAPPPAALSAAECEVWARELSFARSVADRDAEAFAAHLHEDAAFGVSRPGVTRGRAAITAEWAGLIAGTRVRLSWYPTHTAIGGVSDIAWSSGPALYEAVDPADPVQHRIGAFTSVWHRGGDGVWRVLFDDGIAPRPATPEQVAAFRAGRRETCPRG